MKKPTDVCEYKKWAKETLNLNYDSNNKNYYESVVSKMKLEIVNSDFWNEFVELFKDFHYEYYIHSNKYELFSSLEEKPEIVIKPYESFIDKSFRKNVLHNKNFPDEPHQGWITMENFTEKINDLARTVVVVKYMDGVEFFSKKFKLYCEEHKIKSKCFKEARDEGYYAWHLYYNLDIDIPLKDWDMKKVNISVEVQVTTQLQEVIRKLLHSHYSNNRSCKSNNEKWQWDYKSNEFSANYMGHILHYLEGMIVEIRNKQEANTNEF